MIVRAGRAVIYCHACSVPVATISANKVQHTATFTPWRGRTTDTLLKMVTEAAAVICPACEILAHKATQALEHR